MLFTSSSESEPLEQPAGVSHAVLEHPTGGKEVQASLSFVAVPQQGEQGFMEEIFAEMLFSRLKINKCLLKFSFRAT